MDIQALKLELVQHLALTNDAMVLAKVKRLLELLRTRAPGRADEDALVAASTVFGQDAYGEDEPDISGQVLNEPEPIPVLQAQVKGLIDKVRDARVLNSVLAFLQGNEDELLWRTVLGVRAARAEADFAAGRVFTQEQVEAHFKSKQAT